jgi:hypothetical protein
MTSARLATHADWGGYTGAFADPNGYVWEVARNPAVAKSNPDAAPVTSATFPSKEMAENLHATLSSSASLWGSKITSS